MVTVGLTALVRKGLLAGRAGWAEVLRVLRKARIGAIQDTPDRGLAFLIASALAWD